MADQTKPIIFLAFANPPPGARDHLRNLGEEERRLEATLKQAEKTDLCELVVKPYATLDSILTVFREYRHRIAIFHYGGHAHNYHLLLEDAQQGTAAADAGGRWLPFWASSEACSWSFSTAVPPSPRWRDCWRPTCRW